MRTKEQYLAKVEEAYKDQGKVSSTVGLYLREPFAGSRDLAELADTIYDQSKKLEELLRSLYQRKSQADR